MDVRTMQIEPTTQPVVQPTGCCPPFDPAPWQNQEIEGPFRNAPVWVKDMKQYVAAKNRKLERLYFGYTTCPKCAKAYGKNYVVMFAKVEGPGGLIL